MPASAAGHHHGDDDDAALADAGITCSPRAVTHGADLVAKLRAPDHQPDDKGGDQSQQEGHVERGAADVEADGGEQPVEPRQLATVSKGAGLRRHRTGRLEHVDQHDRPSGSRR
jgi:hypothetical protein